ncbi:Gasdermin-B [Pteropus alecto]|uniref:Gasdermin-B n=1 Tax=Pteropus alecto TaxID=9402 RepID=L5JTJ4_PTEAL|nr:Gasdermin-B [Pteropus alecto]
MPSVFETNTRIVVQELDAGGQKAEFQVVDSVDSKGMLTMKLPQPITIAGSSMGPRNRESRYWSPGYPSNI